MRHGDRLDGDLPAGREEPVEGGEVGGPVGLADRLDHLDADDGVVLAVDLAVVLQSDVHAVGHAGRVDPLAGELQLLSGEGDRGDLGSSLRRADGERAPSGADLQQPGAAAYAGEVEDPVDLAQLCLLEPGRGLHGLALVEPRRGVGHRRVQEGGEQVVAQVVVGGDVVARAVEGVLVVDGGRACRRRPAAAATARGTSVVSRAAKGVSRSARSVPGPARQSPAM